MREIKFRAFRERFGDDRSPVMTHPFTLGDLQDKAEFTFTDGGYVSWNEFGLENEATKVMMYTGLKDKNGVEIYEGDIVRAYRDYKEDGEKVLDQIAAVEYDGDTCWSWGSYGSLWNALSWNKDTEVIGNIYENPELLNE